MSGERKAVGPVRKELQGFRVLHQSLEAERCNSLLSDDPTVSSPGSRVCRVYVVVSLESYSSPPSALSGLTHQNPRSTLNPVVYPLGPPWQPSSGSEDHSPLHHAARRTHRVCTGLCLYTSSYLLVAPVV